MKEYQLSLALNGTFLVRTEFLPYDKFKLAIKTLVPLIKANPDISIMFDRRDVQNWTTYDAHIDSENCVDILDELATEDDE